MPINYVNYEQSGEFIKLERNFLTFPTLLINKIKPRSHNESSRQLNIGNFFAQNNMTEITPKVTHKKSLHLPASIIIILNLFN
jgi:hypothetical protein